MIEMTDSVDAHRITGHPALVAGYIDGEFAWSREDWALPAVRGAVKNLITVFGSLIANTYDIENGDGTPEQGAEWIRRKQAAGHRGATIYCARSNLQAVWDACRGEAYYVWVADWTGSPHQVPGTVACQYTNLRAGDVDLSMVYSGEWVRAIDAANRPWPL